MQEEKGSKKEGEQQQQPPTKKSGEDNSHETSKRHSFSNDDNEEEDDDAGNKDQSIPTSSNLEKNNPDSLDLLRVNGGVISSSSSSSSTTASPSQVSSNDMVVTSNNTTNQNNSDSGNDNSSHTPLTSSSNEGKKSKDSSSNQDVSNIFNVLDRRMNFDSFDDANISLYSLIRSWVQDDPYRQLPIPGSNLLSLVSLPSVRRRDVGRIGINYVDDSWNAVEGSHSNKQPKMTNANLDVLSLFRGGKSEKHMMESDETYNDTNPSQPAVEKHKIATLSSKTYQEQQTNSNKDVSSLLQVHIQRATHIRKRKRNAHANKMESNLRRLKELGFISERACMDGNKSGTGEKRRRRKE
uniref:Uncharacterized protein n=1 Tax=Ditylum brightwellii TaxID=49249 RepID=A0A7S1Z5I9_9STRA